LPNQSNLKFQHHSNKNKLRLFTKHAISDVKITTTVMGARVNRHVSTFSSAKKVLIINTPHPITVGERIFCLNR
jgi:hypothetical protein